MEKKKRRLWFFSSALAFLLILCLTAAGLLFERAGVFYEKDFYQPIPLWTAAPAGTDTDESPLVDSTGLSPQTRILPPTGYSRTAAAEGSLLAYMRTMQLEPYGSKITLYSGSETQRPNSGVFAFDMGKEDLQQCADCLIRVYSDYFWQSGQKDKIRFHLTNGTLLSYSDWEQGYRLIAFGSYAKMNKLTGEDTSYDCFRAYLERVMRYAGSLSLERESTVIKPEELRPGDMLVIGGTPGHAVLVLDEARDAQGNACYLLAQGYSPAQSFHILRNPLHLDDPWYYASEMQDGFSTETHTFSPQNFRRWNEGFEN